MKNLHEILNEQLVCDEKVIWSGQPLKRKMFRKSDLIVIPIFILWLMALILFEYMAVDNLIYYQWKGNILTVIPFMFFILPFMVLGFYIAIGRFIFKTLNKKNIIYAVTNSRIIAIRNSSKIKVKSRVISQIDSTKIVANHKGIGTLTFGKHKSFAKLLCAIELEFPWIYKYTDNIVFHDIKNVKSVYDIISGLKHGTNYELSSGK